jgi:mitochondrial cardiolipin hydrolase
MSQETAVHFTRDGSVARLIEAQIRQTRHSVEAALYRLNNPCLVEELAAAARRGVELHLVLDRGKYEETRSTRELLAVHRLPFRLLSGRHGDRAKMHHKFAILDRQTALTGSYNWTAESEDLNYDNLVILHDLGIVAKFSKEFQLLWNASEEATGESV